MGDKVNTNNYTGEGNLNNVTASLLNFGGGHFTLITGDIIPELGNGCEITFVGVAHRIVNSSGQNVKLIAPGTTTSIQNNYIHFSSQTEPGWVVFGEGYQLKAWVEVDYIEGGVLKDKLFTMTFSGISLEPPQVPDISVSANINVLPTKPIHNISISASYNTNGATILQRKIWLRKQGQSYVELPISGTNPFTAGTNRSDSNPPITYDVLAEVQYEGTIYGSPYTGWKQATCQITYYGDGLEA